MIIISILLIISKLNHISEINDEIMNVIKGQDNRQGFYYQDTINRMSNLHSDQMEFLPTHVSKRFGYGLDVIMSLLLRMNEGKDNCQGKYNIDLVISTHIKNATKLDRWVENNINVIQYKFNNIFIIISRLRNESLPSMPNINRINHVYIDMIIQPEFDNHACGSFLLLERAFEVAVSTWFLYAESDLIFGETSHIKKDLECEIYKNDQDCEMIGMVPSPELFLPTNLWFHLNGKALYKRSFYNQLLRVKSTNPLNCTPYDTEMFKLAVRDDILFRKLCYSDRFINTGENEEFRQYLKKFNMLLAS